MRPPALAVFTCLALSPAFAARAENCVDTSQNNSAFSSSYIAGETPCKPKPRVKTPPKPQDVRAARENAKPPTVPVDDATLHRVPTEHGTLFKSGDTTVCVSGSISVDLSAGKGHPGGPGRSPSPGCY